MNFLVSFDPEVRPQRVPRGLANFGIGTPAFCPSVARIALGLRRGKPRGETAREPDRISPP
jgi:hypothetical protein